MKLKLLLIALLLCNVCFGEQADLVGALKENSRNLSLVDGGLQGPGAEFLVSEGKNAEFVLVGEDHGLAEVPQFCLALFTALKPAGFANLAVETGPYEAALLQKLSNESDPVAALRTLDQKHPFSMPFYNWEEEAVLLTTLASHGMHVWGLDQEFILAPSLLFEKLVELAKDPAARKLAQEYLQRSLAEDRQMVEQKNPAVLFMVSATAEDFQKLSAAFPDKSSEAGRIVEEMQVSWEIYQKNFQNKGMDSNLQRAGLMKKHFHEYFDRAASGKTLFKFGAYHAMRGRSLIGVHDLGNHVSELAEGRGQHSFHILVAVIKGTVNAYRPFSADPADKQKPYDFAKELDTADISAFAATASDSTWTVVDLRPVRRKIGSFGTLDRGLEQILWGYDAVVLIPQGHAAKLLN